MACYLSIVWVGRNDDYGGDFNERLENAARWLSELIEAYKLPSELLIINYNPIEDKPQLNTAITWPTNRKYLKIRIITVSKEIHQQYVNPDLRKTLPLFEYIGKNIGIRRAIGEFILSGNPDIIFDPRIIRFFANKKLRKDHYYRADRCDFTRFEKEDGGSRKKYLKEIRKRVFRLYLKGFHYDLKPGNRLSLQLLKLRTHNYFRLKKELLYFRFNRIACYLKIPIVYENAEFRYHCNVSGDIFLMHRVSWWELRGNPENHYLGLHIDAIMVVAAAISGLKEKTFDAPVYHQDHGRRFNMTNSEADPLMLEAYLSFADKSWEMMETKRPIIENTETWGLKGVDLPEEEI